ncbi:MAG: CBS domain-containing protein, partial [Bacteroidota bacterium]
YNWAQAISAPVLGVSTNSPLLLGRELWRETRIGLFQQSIDTRSSSYALKNQQARVTYGDGWAYGSAVDIFKNDIARHRVIMSKDIARSSMQILDDGEIPKLDALRLHNGTIYRWNRPCYGVGNGKPHLRIENRYIPSGPSVVDQMATFAFWVGLMVGRPKHCDDMSNCMDFRDAKENFFKAARAGKASMLVWGDELISVPDLIRKDLIPIAIDGLKKANIQESDIGKYMEVIAQRTAKTTGANWQVRNYRKLRSNMKEDDALRVLTRKIHENQMSNSPVYEWPMVEVVPHDRSAPSTIAHIMSTQLFTINEHDLADLATSIMEWKEIHHLPVENKKGALCGLLTWGHLERFREDSRGRGLTVADIMTTKVITVTPETPIFDAIELMKDFKIGCLPVTHKEHLVGIVTIQDLIHFENGQGSQQSA